MTEEKQRDPLANEILNFSFTVEQTNRILEIIGNAPFIIAAPFVSLIKAQGEPQFEELKKKIKHEPQTTA